MTDFLKDNGSLLSPILAFVLGILAIYIKNAIEKRANKKIIEKRICIVIDIFNHISLPVIAERRMEANAVTNARNDANLTKYYIGLLSIKTMILGLQNDVNHFASALTAHQCALLLSRLDALIIRIHQIWNTSIIDVKEYNSICEEHKRIKDYLGEDWFSLKELEFRR